MKRTVLIEAEFDYGASVQDICACSQELNEMDCNCCTPSRWCFGAVEVVTSKEDRALTVLKRYPVSHIRVFNSLGVDEHFRAKWSPVRKEIGEPRICKRFREMKEVDE